LDTASPVAKSRFLLHAPNGRVIAIEDAASTVEVAGEVVGAVTIFVDISDRIRAERELELERERLEEQVQVTSQALGETRAELKALSGHLMQAQEEERRRVARELHDDLNQRAAIAEIELERLAAVLPEQDQRVHRLAGAVREQIRRLSNGLREVSHRLHPAIVEDLGLPAALRALISEYRENGMDVNFVAGSAASDLPLDIATTLYRTAQEAVRNASRHAPDAPVRVVLERTSEEVRVQVEDAGPGFDLEQVRGKGLGLLSMQERARLVGGTLLLRTRPGEGTLILVRVPLASDSRPPSA
jgi:signal transduction histidine kinase